MSGAFRDVDGVGGLVRSALRASAWAALATAPLTLIYFGQLAPWTIAATPLLSPLVALMLASGLVVAACGGCLPLLATVAAPLASWPTASSQRLTVRGARNEERGA